MNLQLPFSGALVLLALFATLPAVGSAAQAAQDKDEKEIVEDRRVLIDVGGQGSRLWGLHQGGYLGIQMVDLTPELRTHFGVDESSGVMVGSVAADSPAAAAGLAVGDIITSIDGAPINGRGALGRLIARYGEGDSISLEVFRDGAFQVIEARVGQRERPQLWLDSLGEGSHYSMQWRSDDGNVLVLPTPGSEPVQIRRERLEEVMGHLHERLASPDFNANMLEFRSNTEELEERIKELEKRLLELSAQLEKLEN